MNFSESRQNRSRENREKSKNRFFPPPLVKGVWVFVVPVISIVYLDITLCKQQALFACSLFHTFSLKVWVLCQLHHRTGVYAEAMHAAHHFAWMIDHGSHRGGLGEIDCCSSTTEALISTHYFSTVCEIKTTTIFFCFMFSMYVFSSHHMCYLYTDIWCKNKALCQNSLFDWPPHSFFQTEWRPCQLFIYISWSDVNKYFTAIRLNVRDAAVGLKALSHLCPAAFLWPQ